MVIICITTSIIYTFNAHNKYSIPQAYHLNYDAIIRNHEHYLRYGIHHSKCYLQRYFETCPIVSNITTNCPKAHCKYLRKTQKIFTNKSPWQHMHTTQPMWASPSKKHQQEAKDWEWTTNPCSSLTKKQLESPTRELSLWRWTRGCSISFLPPSTWREQCPRVLISAKV